MACTALVPAREFRIDPVFAVVSIILSEPGYPLASAAAFDLYAAEDQDEDEDDAEEFEDEWDDSEEDDSDEDEDDDWDEDDDV